MLIHVVQQGETIESIANYYGIAVMRLICDNGLKRSENLVIGHSLVIANPEITYTVKEGDTLADIAEAYNITLMQLYRNNPFLSERESIYAGETIVIKYNTNGKIITHGNAVPFIDMSTLKKTLPYLTYLSILNFTATDEGEVITYYDDTEMIQTAKEYGVMPLMLVTTLSIKGEANVGIAYDILLNDGFQDRQIETLLNLLETKGYYGVNLSFEYINISNMRLYETYFAKMAASLSEKGYLIFATIGTNIMEVNNEIRFERIDYSLFNQVAHNIIFMDYKWATNITPPSPIISISNIEVFLNYVSTFISPEKEIIGIATVGYDWELPFSSGISSVYFLTQENAVDLARNVGATIQFDETSKTPYFNYTIKRDGNEVAHIVWFVDARSESAILDLIVQNQLNGIGIWNITVFNPQLWVIINSQFEIGKVLNE